MPALEEKVSPFLVDPTKRARFGSQGMYPANSREAAQGAAYVMVRRYGIDSTEILSSKMRSRSHLEPEIRLPKRLLERPGS